MTNATIVSVAGLVLDAAAAMILLTGLLARDTTIFRVSREMLKADPHGVPREWYRRLPVFFAFRFGSDDVRNTQPSHIDDYVRNFWGLLLLAGGFILQAVGQVLGEMK